MGTTKYLCKAFQNSCFCNSVIFNPKILIKASPSMNFSISLPSFPELMFLQFYVPMIIFVNKGQKLHRG